MASRYQGSYSGLGEMLNEGFMVAEMERRARKGEALAISIAPVGTPPEDAHPGLYKSSFEVASGSHGGAKGDRAWAGLGNTTKYALQVEFGGKHGQGHHVLLKALMAMGD